MAVKKFLSGDGCHDTREERFLGFFGVLGRFPEMCKLLGNYVVSQHFLQSYSPIYFPLGNRCSIP
jgi:hypothetical protein